MLSGNSVKNKRFKRDTQSPYFSLKTLTSGGDIICQLVVGETWLGTWHHIFILVGVSVTYYHTLSGINSVFISPTSGGWGIHQGNPVSGGGLLPAFQMPIFLLCPCIGGAWKGRIEGQPSPSFRRVPIPHEVSLSWTTYFPVSKQHHPGNQGSTRELGKGLQFIETYRIGVQSVLSKFNWIGI